MNLASRIILDKVCVIEGDYDELNQALGQINGWIMEEECKVRNLDYRRLNQMREATYAINRRLSYLKEQMDGQSDG